MPYILRWIVLPTHEIDDIRYTIKENGQIKFPNRTPGKLYILPGDFCVKIKKRQGKHS